MIRWMNNIYTRHIMPFTASMIARDRSGAYKYLPKSVETFPDPEAFMGELRDAGFSNVQRHAMTFGVCSAYVGEKSK
jgi:demethylmenaquinone methyltransferase/2-methoxy-6-polyprenyl-1,4-benzoquinol methylase